MKTVKIIVQTIVGILLVTAIIGWILPSDVSIYREITINAPAEKIYTVVNDMQQMQSWSPWHSIDPENTTYTFEGSVGVGSSMKWESTHPDIGSGSQEIVANETNKIVKTELYFADMENASYASFYIEEEDGVSNVKWDYQADFGTNPYFHYLTLIMDSMLGSSYEQGLANLKEVVENLPDPEPIEEVSIESDSTMMESDEEIM